MAKIANALIADVLIVGAGLVGSCLALALGNIGREVLLIAPSTPSDQRTSALMMPNTQFLAKLSLFDAPEELATPLERIRLIDATQRLIRAPETLFDCKSADLTAFSYNFSNAKLLEAMSREIDKLKNVTVVSDVATGFERRDDAWHISTRTHGQFKSKLLVGADGKKSTVRDALNISTRQHNFEQSALVCDLELERPLDRESVEFHYPNGPFTLVSAGGKKANLVWVDRHAILAEAQLEKPSALAAILAEKAHCLFGRFTMTTKTFVYPLSTLTANRFGDIGAVLVGEAAHAFPPIGAQGLNLGLRDVRTLLNACERTQGQPLDDTASTWADNVTKTYAQQRSADIERTSALVDTLFRSLLSDMLPQQFLRAGGIWGLKTLPFLQRQAFTVGMGGN